MLTQHTGQYGSEPEGKRGASAAKTADTPLLDGTIRVFLADLLMVPTGLLTVALLTRQFGPEGYGIFAVAASFVAWIEWGLASLFSRATIHLVGETDNWKPIAGALLRWHLAAGGMAMLGLWALARPIASLLQEPSLAVYLPLFAVDIPLFTLAQAHRNILTGIGRFRPRALASVGRWISRLVLIVLLVELGFSIPGAIVGSIGASLVELLIGRYYLRSSWFETSTWFALPFPRSALPLVWSSASLSSYTRLDLFALKILGGTAGQAGLYGAAQNLSILPGIFAQGFSALLLSTLSRAISRGETGQAKETARDALRVALGLLPIAGLFAGAAAGITQLCFGPAFRPAAPLLAVLIFGAVAQVLIAVAMAILTAAGRPRWTLVLTGPMIPLAVVGHAVLIPKFGLLAAALVTTGVGCLGALASLVAVSRLGHVQFPLATLFRSALLCAIAYVLAGAGPDSPVWLLLRLAALAFALVAAFWLLEEFREANLSRFRWLVPQVTRVDPVDREP
jgi:O-antigen/teichoic acid export membrane protein